MWGSIAVEIVNTIQHHLLVVPELITQSTYQVNLCIFEITCTVVGITRLMEMVQGMGMVIW